MIGSAFATGTPNLQTQPGSPWAFSPSALQGTQPFGLQAQPYGQQLSNVPGAGWNTPSGLPLQQIAQLLQIVPQQLQQLQQLEYVQQQQLAQVHQLLQLVPAQLQQLQQLIQLLPYQIQQLQQLAQLQPFGQQQNLGASYGAIQPSAFSPLHGQVSPGIWPQGFATQSHVM